MGINDYFQQVHRPLLHLQRLSDLLKPEVVRNELFHLYVTPEEVMRDLVGIQWR
jgi:hypothetical protein